jgi:hypothetical protein
MNSLRLTGKLVSVPSFTQKKGCSDRCTARLRFDLKNEPVIIYTTSENARRLADMKQGQCLAIEGRLSIFGTGLPSIVIGNMHRIDRVNFDEMGVKELGWNPLDLPKEWFAENKI